MVRLETERLIIRKPRSKDAEDVIEGIGNPNVAEWLATLPFPYGKKQFIQFLKKNHDKSEMPLLIELKSGREVIGGVGASFEKIVNKATIGYWINEDYWGEGYVSEAINEFLRYLFKDLNINRVEAFVRVGNKKSSQILKKFGAKKEGMKRQSTFNTVTKKVLDEEVYGILKSEFKPLKKKK